MKSFSIDGDGRKLISYLQITKILEMLTQVDYVVRAQWSNMYIVDVTAIVNCSAQQKRSERFGVKSWEIEFTLMPGHSLTRHWNASFRQDGDDVQGNKVFVTHNKFSSPVRGKAMLYFGFEVTVDKRAPEGPSVPSIPATMIVNSQVCEVDAYFARELADCAFDYVAEQSRSPSPSPPASREPSPGPPMRRSKSAPPVLQIAPFEFLHDVNIQSDTLPPTDCRYLQPTSSEAASEASTPLDEAQHAVDEGTNQQAQNSIEVDSGCPGPSACLTECISQIESKESETKDSGKSEVTSLLGKRKVSEDESDLIESSDSLQRKSPALVTGAPRTLKLEYYRRSEQLKKRKFRHMDWIDATFKSREKLVLNTVLNDSSIILEPNMFPYDTPAGVSHWTLWSRNWLKDEEIEDFLQGWIRRNMPEVVEWNFDDNMSDGLSINLFHVHVYMRCDV